MNTLLDGQPQGTEKRYNCKFQSYYKSKNSDIRGINHYYEHYHELSSDYDNLIRMNSELYDNCVVMVVVSWLRTVCILLTRCIVTNMIHLQG